MAESHKKSGINNGDFHARVEVLIDATESLAVPQAAQNRLLAKLAPMHEDIVN